MSRPPAAVEADESVRSVAQGPIAGDVGALLVEATGVPVRDVDGRWVGLVSLRDVLGVLLGAVNRD